MKFEEKQINSISELLSHLSDDLQSIKSPVWYRGDANKNWDLVPSLFRGNSKKEIDYLKEFKQDAILLVEPRPQHSYEWLFLMRHNHIPTRLLDWTESPLVATFFAINDTKNIDEDGALWMLLPLELNKYIEELSDEETLPSFEENSFLNSYTTDEFDRSNPENSRKTVAFLAPRNSPRMHSQLSVFTINHHNKTPIDKLGDGNHIWRYIIPKSSKKKLQNELKLLKINYFQLFPELPYIFDKIREG